MHFYEEFLKELLQSPESLGCVLGRHRGPLVLTGLQTLLKQTYRVFFPRRDKTVMKLGNLPERGTKVNGKDEVRAE